MGADRAAQFLLKICTLCVRFGALGLTVFSPREADQISSRRTLYI